MQDHGILLFTVYRSTPHDGGACVCCVVDDFNEGLILPTLIRQLKSILDQYPDDGQILKVSFLHIFVPVIYH